MSTSDPAGSPPSPPAAPPSLPAAPPSPPSPPSPPAAPPSPPSPPAAPAAAAAPFEFGEVGQDDRLFMEKNGYKTVADALKGARYMEQLIGADPKSVLRLPSDRSDPKAMEPIYKALGMPDAPDGYGMKPNDEIGLSEPIVKGLSEVLHKAGASKSVADALVGWYTEAQKADGEAFAASEQQRLDAAIATLQKEWGAAYQQKLDAANAYIKAEGGEDLSAFLKESGLGNDPRWARFIDKIVAKVTDPTDLPGERGRDAGFKGLTPLQAEAQLGVFESANAAALSDRSHPDHKRIVAEREELLRQMAPPLPKT